MKKLIDRKMNKWIFRLTLPLNFPLSYMVTKLQDNRLTLKQSWTWYLELCKDKSK